MCRIQIHAHSFKRKDGAIKGRLKLNPRPAIGIWILQLYRITRSPKKRMLRIFHKAGDSGKVNNTGSIAVRKMGYTVIGKKGHGVFMATFTGITNLYQ